MHSPFIQKGTYNLALVCKDCAGRYRAVLLIYVSAKPLGVQGPKLRTWKAVWRHEGQDACSVSGGAIFSSVFVMKRGMFGQYIIKHNWKRSGLLKASMAAHLGKSPGRSFHFAQNPLLCVIHFWPSPGTRSKQTALQCGATVTNMHQKVTYGTEAEKALTPWRWKICSFCRRTWIYM